MPSGISQVGSTVQEHWFEDFDQEELRLALTALERKQKRGDPFITTTTFGRHFGLMNFLFRRFDSFGRGPQRVGVFGMGKSASEPRELAMLFPDVIVEGFDGSVEVLEAATHPAPVFQINPKLLDQPAYVEYLSHLGISREKLVAHSFSYPIERGISARVHPHRLLFGAELVPAMSPGLGLATCLHVCEHFPNVLLARLLGLEMATTLEVGGMMVFDGGPFAPWFLSDAEGEELGFDVQHLRLPCISHTSSSGDYRITTMAYKVYTKREEAPLAELAELIRKNVARERQFFAERRSARELHHSHRYQHATHHDVAHAGGVPAVEAAANAEAELPVEEIIAETGL